MNEETQLELNLEFNIAEGQPLYPQPPVYSDCCHMYKRNGEIKNGSYGFYEGNEMEGHYLVREVETVQDLHPELHDRIWVWTKNIPGINIYGHPE